MQQARHVGLDTPSSLANHSLSQRAANGQISQDDQERNMQLVLLLLVSSSVKVALVCTIIDGNTVLH